jgi:hypothetical protein
MEQSSFIETLIVAQLFEKSLVWSLNLPSFKNPPLH